MIESVIVFVEYVLSCIFFRNSAADMIETVRINLKLYPKHYVQISRWMRNLFNIRKCEIPKYLAFRLYLSLFWGLSAPIVAIICLFTQQQNIIGTIIFIPCMFAIPDTIIFVVVSHFFKR